MKNSANKFRIALIAMVTLFSVALTSTAVAGNNDGGFPVDAKYYASGTQSGVFQLTFTNDNAEEFEITVTDGFNTIYTETVKGKGQVRNFKFLKNETNNEATEDNQRVVEVVNKKTKNVITFNLDLNNHTQVRTETIAML